MRKKEIRAAAEKVAALLPNTDHIESFWGDDDQWHAG
jgi:hypothetical protein